LGWELNMRDILEAEIASLEELAGQLKGLSEMKPRIADAEYPPKNSESFRRKALEHNRDAIAALTAAHTLKIILAARTKTEQIALMRHYVLEFGQQASRDAKLSKSLADDDPLKAKIDDSVSSSTFVVSTLNGILSDIAPAPAYVSPSTTVHPTIAGRLGQVLSWAAILVALATLGLFLVFAINDPNQASVFLIIGTVIAAVICGLRYVVAGS
jgi:hypothetical protein